MVDCTVSGSGARPVAILGVCFVLLAMDCGSATAASPARNARHRPGPDRPYTGWQAPAGLDPAARIAHARRREPDLRRVFATAGLTWPPAQLLFRVFKQEHELEVWAASTARGRLRRVTTYGICAAPRRPGPKSRQGDGMVPEGFYRIDAFNPGSAYHLSMRIDYPNAWDRQRSRAPALGGAIMIHGDCVSIGCLAMTDQRIEELWWLARTVHRRGKTVHVHLFPTRDLDGLIARAADPEAAAFWRSLLAGKASFERTRRIPRPGNDGGRYVFR